MHVIVVGCGRVGAALAERLEARDHTTAVIDRHASAFRRLHDGHAGRTLVGIGFDRDLLITAGIEQAGALAAVTNGDNSNILVARTAREQFGVERVVARIYDHRRAEVYERLGIPTIATVQWTTDQVLRRILPHEAGVEWTDPSTKVVLVERPLPAAWAGHPATDLEAVGGARVVALSRLGTAEVPGPGLILQDGDVVHVAVGVDAIQRLDDHVAQGPGGHP